MTPTQIWSNRAIRMCFHMNTLKIIHWSVLNKIKCAALLQRGQYDSLHPTLTIVYTSIRKWRCNNYYDLMLVGKITSVKFYGE